MSTTPLVYGDPSLSGSWARGIIPTIVNSSSVAEKNRNQVFVVGRAKVNAAVLNNIQAPLVADPPLDANDVTTDQYIYFHLVYEPMASSLSPPSQTVVAGPKRLAFISQYILQSNTGPSFTPVPFILNTSGTPVAGGNAQAFTLAPIGLTNPNAVPNLNYTLGPTYNTSAYDASTLPKTPFFLAPQGTDSIKIYKDDGEGVISTPIDSLAALSPNLEPQFAYTGVWYKTYISASAAQAELPNTSNLWHVFNPFKNSVNGLFTGILSQTQVQLAPFTGGGQVLPVYVEGTGTPPNFSQSPTATLVYNNAQPNPLTLAQCVEMTADINDVGNVMANWGLDEMEIMLIPVQSSIFYSGGTSPSFGCYTSFPVNSLAQFQSFVSTAYNQPLSYIDPVSGEPVLTKGCTNNTTNNWLSTSLLTNTPTKVYEFNNCMLTSSSQCNTTSTGADGFWYQYCTGNEICGSNNCLGNCPPTNLGGYVPCVRDYSFTQISTGGSTFWSCNPKQPRPNGPTSSGNMSSQTWLMIILIIFVVILVIMGILFLLWTMRKNEKADEAEVVVAQQQQVYNGPYYPY